MPSVAHEHWSTSLCDQLDELEAVHASATGTGPGRRWGTRQFNGTLYVSLGGNFQNYCRNLHDEALDHLRGQGPMGRVLAQQAATSRMLDKGNPNRSNLQHDFGRLGIHLMDDIKARRNGEVRLRRLDAVMKMRNGISHGDAARIAEAEQAGARATLTSYRAHRSALNSLTVDMEAVVQHHLRALTGAAPW